jgi:hypothetical protein
MDGVLPAEEQRQLGDKVDASPVARQLVERIHAVVDNPHLSAPRVDAKGLGGDPDTVAEFLDNTLPADRLEAFERICLESDMHLAEVAACHSILARVARDPSVVPPLDAAHRRRLLESMQHRIAAARTSGRLERGPSTAPPQRGPIPAPLPTAVAAGNDGATNDRLKASPAKPASAPRAPSRRTPWAAWAIASSALGLLAILAALFAQSVGAFRRSAPPEERLAGGAPQVPGGAIDPAPVNPPPAGAPPAGAVDDGVAELAAAAPAADPGAGDRAVTNQADAIDVERSPPAPDGGREADLVAGEGPADPAADAVVEDGPEAVARMDGAGAAPAPRAPVVVPPAGPAKVRAGEALAIAAGVRPPRAGAQPAAVPGGAPAGDDVAGDVGLDGGAGATETSIGFVAADGVPLRRVMDGDRGWWEPIGIGTPLREREELVVPPGMHPELNLGGISLRILPRSHLALSVADDGTPRVELVSGRIVARAARADARLEILAGGIDAAVTAGLDGAVAVETAAAWHAGIGDEAVPIRATLLAVTKPLHLTKSGGVPAPESEADFPARSGLVVESSGGERREGVRLDRLPGWTTGAERIDALERNAMEAFVSRLAQLPPGSDAGAGLEQVLLAMAIDRRVENRVFAANTLALLGGYEVAVEGLCAEGLGRKLEARQWSALEAASIPLALSRGAESAARLRKAFEDRGPAGRAELLMAMARGPTDAELESGADAVLVESLSDPALVVRRYALACLVEIVGPSAFDRGRFRPDGPEESRRDAIGWWRSLLDKGGIRRSR